jgi:hypothetical protein
MVRRADLDWLRVGAFGLLILYHIALFFAPWDWHVNSRHNDAWVAQALVASNPWRLLLLFFVSGAALRYMARTRTATDIAVDRSVRLLLPLLFGIFFLVPPQAYVESVQKLGYAGSFTGYWRDMVTIPVSTCLAGRCETIPLNHLWFIAFIWAYALIAAVLMMMPRLLERLDAAVGWLMKGPALLLVPIAYLAVMRLNLYPLFGVRNVLWGDWYHHSIALPIFLLGFLMSGRVSFWQGFDRWRWPALALAVFASAPLIAQGAIHNSAEMSGTGFMAVLFATAQWGAIAALSGFAYRHLADADGPLLRYLSAGVFPFYLVHQTIIVLVAYWLDPYSLSAAAEFTVLILATAVGCVISYEIARRIAILRPFLGLRKAPPRASTPAF